MAFADYVEQAAADILEHIGVEAVFTPASGDPVTLQVDLVEEVADQPPPFQTQVWGPTTTAEYRFADIGRKAAEGETFTVGATVYTVTEIMECDGYFVKCAVKA